jgi:Tol biopolymer transport system component
MKFRRSAALFVLTVALGASGSAQPQPSERDFLSRIRRLTIEGRRSGEGYWSKDGRQLVFQSEREPGNPFYQIYLMDMETGNTTRVSPGTGKTTCSFINPATGDILFASTHHDPRSKALQDEELKFRASGQERRYSWDYDLSTSDEQARLRRREQLLARRTVDRVLVHTRRL